MPAKMFWIKFCPGDWLKDPNLSKCSPATRGIWIDLICAMHESSRSGKISGTAAQLARVCRCTAAEMQAAIDELNATETATVTQRTNFVTLINRRMHAEAKTREQNTMRQRRKRGASDVTQASQDRVRVRGYMLEPSCIPPVENEPEKPDPKHGERFQILFENYPPHRRTSMQQEALFEFCALKPDQAMFERILSALETQKASDEWTEKNGKYVPGLLKWIRGRGWEAVTTTTKPAPCRTCAGIGVVCRDGEKLFPWSEELAWGRELKSEICPDCKGKNRMYPPPPGCPL